jgi:GxxExxY protein
MPHVDLATVNPLTDRIIRAGIEVHRRLGPGLLESVYHACLSLELRAFGFQLVEALKVPVKYKGLTFPAAFRIDMLVNDTVVLELKAVAAIAPIHEAQLLTYLRLANRPVGLLMNFNVPVLKDGIRRKLNAAHDPNHPFSIATKKVSEPPSSPSL